MCVCVCVCVRVCVCLRVCMHVCVRVTATSGSHRLSASLDSNQQEMLNCLTEIRQAHMHSCTVHTYTHTYIHSFYIATHIRTYRAVAKA